MKLNCRQLTVNFNLGIKPARLAFQTGEAPRESERQITPEEAKFAKEYKNIYEKYAKQNKTLKFESETNVGKGKEKITYSIKFRADGLIDLNIARGEGKADRNDITYAKFLEIVKGQKNLREGLQAANEQLAPQPAAKPTEIKDDEKKPEPKKEAPKPAPKKETDKKKETKSEKPVEKAFDQNKENAARKGFVDKYPNLVKRYVSDEDKPVLELETYTKGQEKPTVFIIKFNKTGLAMDITQKGPDREVSLSNQSYQKLAELIAESKKIKEKDKPDLEEALIAKNNQEIVVKTAGPRLEKQKREEFLSNYGKLIVDNKISLATKGYEYEFVFNKAKIQVKEGNKTIEREVFTKVGMKLTDLSKKEGDKNRILSVPDGNFATLMVTIESRADLKKAFEDAKVNQSEEGEKKAREADEAEKKAKEEAEQERTAYHEKLEKYLNSEGLKQLSGKALNSQELKTMEDFGKAVGDLFRKFRKDNPIKFPEKAGKDMTAKINFDGFDYNVVFTKDGNLNYSAINNKQLAEKILFATAAPLAAEMNIAKNYGEFVLKKADGKLLTPQEVGQSSNAVVQVIKFMSLIVDDNPKASLSDQESALNEHFSRMTGNYRQDIIRSLRGRTINYRSGKDIVTLELDKDNILRIKVK